MMSLGPIYSPTPLYNRSQYVRAICPQKTQSLNRSSIPKPSDEILLRRYQPILILDKRDTPPIALKDLMQYSTLKQYRSNGQHFSLVYQPTLEDLRRYNAPHFCLDYSIELVENHLKAGILPPTIYGKVLETNNAKSLFYFYYFPASGIPRISRKVKVHPGDIEGVQVLLNKFNLEPIGIFAFQHYGGKSYRWKQIQKSGKQPLIELEHNSHASYPVIASTHRKKEPIDYQLEIITRDNHMYFDWRGRIGGFSTYPLLNRFKQTLPAVTAIARGPIARQVTPEFIDFELNASDNPELVFRRFL